MKRFLSAAALLALPSLGGAQECAPDLTSIGWTQPLNASIQSDNSERWRLDASIRLAFGGPWVPEAAHFDLVRFKGGEVLEQVPAQVRFITPFTLVENSPPPLTVVEIDPIEQLEPRSDYRLTVYPTAPSLAIYEEYILEFRTARTVLDPLPEFLGIDGVELAGDRCDLEAGPFIQLNDTNPACIISTQLRVSVLFQPLDRSDVAYTIYRTNSYLLDEAGAPVDAEGNPIDPEQSRVELPLAVLKGSADTLGGGVPAIRAPLQLLYGPQPRRDCFSVRMIDEWGRERGDVGNEACIDIRPLAPCPTGCVDMECQINFPDPNPFETNEPLPGPAFGNIGLNGANANQPIPPVGVDPEADAGVGADDGGPGAAADGGANETDGGGGGGGCSQSDGGTSDLGFGLAFLALLGLRRRS